jgi:hypothetical protein
MKAAPVYEFSDQLVQEIVFLFMRRIIGVRVWPVNRLYLAIFVECARIVHGRASVSSWTAA